MCWDKPKVMGIMSLLTVFLVMIIIIIIQASTGGSDSTDGTDDFREAFELALVILGSPPPRWSERSRWRKCGNTSHAR